MKRLALEARLKRKVWKLKLSLLKHRLEYSIYQKPEMALFWFVMFGLFVVQGMLYFGGR